MFSEKTIFIHFWTRYGLTGHRGLYCGEVPGSRSLIVLFDQTDPDHHRGQSCPFTSFIFSIFTAPQPKHYVLGPYAAKSTLPVNGVLLRVIPTTKNSTRGIPLSRSIPREGKMALWTMTYPQESHNAPGTDSRRTLWRTRDAPVTHARIPLGKKKQNRTSWGN